MGVKKTYRNSKGGSRPVNLVLYKTQIFTQKAKPTNLIDTTDNFCNAKAGSNGFDYITTYVHEKVNNGGIIEKLAYVECDYVE